MIIQLLITWGVISIIAITHYIRHYIGIPKRKRSSIIWTFFSLLICITFSPIYLGLVIYNQN